MLDTILQEHGTDVAFAKAASDANLKDVLTGLGRYVAGIYRLNDLQNFEDDLLAIRKRHAFPWR